MSLIGKWVTEDGYRLVFNACGVEDKADIKIKASANGDVKITIPKTEFFSSVDYEYKTNNGMLNAKGIKATYKNGILDVKIPFTKESKGVDISVE